MSGSKNTPNGDSRKPAARGTLALAAVVCVLLVWGYVHYAKKGSRPEGPLVAPVAQEPSSKGRAEPASIPVASATNAVSGLAAQLNDSNSAPKTRRQAARELARNGSDDSVAALSRALVQAPPYLKSAIAEALGGSPNPHARTLLLELVDSRDEAVARGAIRGLGTRGDPEAADVLANLLLNPQKSSELRTEAASALAEVNQPGAVAALTRAAREAGDPEVVGAALEALGQRPFAETEPFFREYLANPNLSTEAKVAALEALGNSTGDVAALLMPFASDPSQEVRAAAAWGISATESKADLGQQITGLLKQESDAEVRMRLFEALAGQQQYDRAAVLPLVAHEADPAARLAGLSLVGDWVHTAPTPDLLGFFNETAVPELKNTALTDTSPASRLASVITLRRGGTPEAGRALEEISRLAPDPRTAQAATSALQAQKK